MESYYPIFTKILNQELLTALGCTEPICIAYCSAEMRKALGAEPEKISVRCSGNLVKNAKGATVPNSGGLKGIAASAILGAVGGNPEKKLELLTEVTPEQIAHAKELLAADICEVKLLEHEEDNLQVVITGTANGHTAEAELKHTHTNICRIVRDGVTLFENNTAAEQDRGEIDKLCAELTVRRIIDYAEHVDLDGADSPRSIIEHQIACNTQISVEGLKNDWGASVGKVLLDQDKSVRMRAAASAAAGSDARMSGCELPVVINSGSGNQGITVTMPVIQYAAEWKKSHDETIRALLISNLVAIHIKAAYGRLSAFCGAVSAATGSSAAITWMAGGTYEQICAAITNTLGTISGMVCDGAKPSCASKIASAVETAITGYNMAMHSEQFCGGDGLVKDDIEQTIRSIGRMASEGMVATDQKILELMLAKEV